MDSPRRRQRRCNTRFRGAIFRSMADSWAPNEEPARLARESIDSLRDSRPFGSRATRQRRKNRATTRREITPPSDSLSFGRRLLNCALANRQWQAISCYNPIHVQSTTVALLLKIQFVIFASRQKRLRS